MKVLLINPAAQEQSVARDMAGGLGFEGKGIVLPPLELAYMAATLLAKQHEAKITDFTVEDYANKDSYQIIKEYGPQIIIANVSLPALYKDCAFLKEMRKCVDAKIFIKTNIAYPDILKEILERSDADVCIYGECDIAIAEIIAGIEKRGTAYFKDGQLKIEENLVIGDLDRLPIPARNLLPNDKYKYVLLGDYVTTMQTSRGCPFPCAYYCPYPLVQGKNWRTMSPGHIVSEIEDIANNYRIKKILFRDATFTLDKERTRRICNLLIEKKLEVKWWCETRADCLDEEIMRLMKEAGCCGMNIGVETGNPQLMATQAKIGLTLEKLKAVRKSAKRLGIRLHFLLLIGLPKETKKTIFETYRLIRSLNPETFGICVITPYPGTLLYEEAKAKKWLETEDWSKFGGHIPVAHTDNLSSQDLLRAQQMLYEGLCLSKNRLIDRIKSMLFEQRFKKWILR